MELDFENLKNEFIIYLENHDVWVLSTCAETLVTSCNMSIVNREESIFFQTDKTSRKMQQILKNPHVALCFTNFQIEGVALVMGSPLEESQRFFRELYAQRHAKSYERHTALKNEIVVKVSPRQAAIWKYVNDHPVFDIVDFSQQKAYRVDYQMT